ncbi:MAG: HAD family phosphatase [Thiomicrospira sp.]|uniref:HAD family hydrolase n=1 Tax=Thiomicrospira sp. TaxID=935 RepID=UPI0019EA5190|nr:HAD family hydrolase [Thiomicrospira sp.]MBE0493465.1 HAD family phosphatase [Thiomicrospira sp.]
MIKLVVIDLDGTLLNPDHFISEVSKQTLRQLHQHGVEVMLATGRHYQDVYLLAQQLQIPTRLITSNGARVHNKQAKLIYENHIPQGLVKDILVLSSGYEVHRNLYQQDLWLVEEPNEPLLKIHHSSGFEYQVTDFDIIDYQHIDKFYFNASHEKLVPLQQRLSAKFGDQLYITFTTENYLEIMNKGVSKGQALKKVLLQKNIKPSEVMAFGDGLNDVDMLKLVGYPVLMDNAHPDLKTQLTQAAKTKSNAEDGVAYYLQTHLLKKTLD